MAGEAGGDRGGQRAAERRLVRVSGRVLFGNGALHDVRTLDVSAGGAGLEHERPFPPAGTRGRLRLQVLADGRPATFETEFEVRYSCVAGHAFRSGVQFVNLARAQSDLLAQVSLNRPLVKPA